MLRSLCYKILMLLGLIPFIGFACLAHANTFMSQHDAIMFYVSYGGVILSFLGGIEWGLVINEQKNRYAVPLVMSNILALMAWSAVLTLSHMLALWILLTGFIVALLIDWYCLRMKLITITFFSWRVLITVVVILTMTTLF